MEFTRVAIIGAGGIGSWFAFQLERLMLTKQLGDVEEVVVYDPDLVERKNLAHQLFYEEEIGAPKAGILAMRHGFTPRPFKFEAKHTGGHMFFIICADNPGVRKVIYDHCELAEKEFLDMRCEGSRYSLLTSFCSKEVLARSLGETPTSEVGRSCQRAVDTEAGQIQLGNFAVGAAGCQLLMDWRRGLAVPGYLSGSVLSGALVDAGRAA